MANPLEQYMPKQENPLAQYMPKQEVSAQKNPLEQYMPTRSSVQEEDIFSEMNPLMKTIDIISRPGYAVKSGIKEAITDTPKTIPEAMLGGLQGKERVFANDLWKKAGVSGVPLLGLATEIALDPLTYIPGGVYAAAGKGIKAGVTAPVKLAAKIPGVRGATQPLVAGLKKAFVNKSGIPELSNLIDLYLSKRKFLKGKEMEFGIGARNAIQNISKKTKLPISKIEEMTVSLIENPTTMNPSIPADVQNLARIFKNHFSNMLTSEMKAGVPITSLAGGIKNIEYFPRIATHEAKRYLQQAAKANYGGNAKVWWPKIQNALQRRTKDYTLAEFNELVAQHGLKSLGGRAVEKFFLQKPAQAVYIRGARSAKAITSAEFLNDVGKQLGKEVGETGWVKLPEAVIKLNPSLAGKFFHPEVAEEVARVIPQYLDTAPANSIVQAFDSVQGLWKKWTLAPFAKYHLRNMVGNLWNNHLAGIHDPRLYAKAQALQSWHKFKNPKNSLELALKNKAIKDLDFWKITPQKADYLIKNADEAGVLGRGWYGGDIEETAEQIAKRGFRGKPLKEKIKQVVLPSGNNVVVKGGMAVGTAIENNARLAHFLGKLDMGDDVATAAASVKKYLFDYQDLTSFEKNVMRRIMPFYTWTRKNLPLQLETLFRDPKKFLPLIPALRNKNPHELLQMKYASPQMYERLPIELKRTVDSVTYIPLEGLIPAADLAKMVRPQELFIELLSPYLKTPIEWSINKSFYTERDIEKYSKETQELLGMDIPAKVKYAIVTIAPQARMLNSINGMIRKKKLQDLGKDVQYTRSEAALYHTLTYIYKIPLEDLQKRASQTVRRKMEDVRTGYFWAREYGRDTEQKRIKEEIKRIRVELKDIK